MSDSDLSDSSYHTAMDSFDKEEFDLPASIIEDGGELIEDQKKFDLVHFEERESASGLRPTKAKETLKIFKIGRVTKAKKNAFSLSGYQYQRFRDEIKKHYLLNIQSQNYKFLQAADLVKILKRDASLKDAGDSCDTKEEHFAFSEEKAINIQCDPWKSEAVPSNPKDTDNFFSFEDSFACYYSRPLSKVKVEKSAVITAVTVQPTSLSCSIEQFEDKGNLLEDVVEPFSVCSWFRAKWDAIRETCCSICVCTE